MKSLLSILIVTILFSCNSKKNSNENMKNTVADTIATPITTAEKIAQAHGFEEWSDVSEIAFTFNVDRGENHNERSWIWKPKTGDITMMSAQDTITYNRSKIDSLIMKTDGAFINDKFWLLAPYQLVWDQGITTSEKQNVVAPISKDTLNQLTIVYGNDGGYTPGDGYDFFYDENYILKEWNYRQANAEKPTMSTTWEDFENLNGLKIAKTHKDSTGNFKLYFTNISVKKETAN